MLRGVLVCLALGVCACVGRPAGIPTSSRAGPIQASDVASVSATNAYDIVRQLRRGWLVARGPVSVSDSRPALPKVYMDGVEVGELDFLRSIAASDVAEIEFLSTQESNLRYGSGHFGGIIQVRTRRGGEDPLSGQLDGTDVPATSRAERGAVGSP